MTARLERIDPEHEGEIETVKARYVVGCDGARSAVRKSLGYTLHGDSANHAWGVMDVLAVTDFPDVRCKTLIQSAKDGSIVIIPREGGYLFRLYIELDKLDAGERVSNRNITADDLIATARRIFNPYSLDVKEIAWWSVYEIGQRLCDKFDDVAESNSDAAALRLHRRRCLPHPQPEGGPGMNVSMQDGFNLGWKLAAVLRKRCAPHLLKSYSAERQVIAKELIDFDREWAQVISSSTAANGNGKAFDPDLTQRYFVQHLRYTAGTVTRYPAVAAHRRGDASASRRRLQDRHALPFGAGHPRRGCQARAARSHHQGGRALAHLRFCAGRGSRQRELRCSRAVRLPRRGAAVPGSEVHAGGRQHRCGDRRPGGLSARPSRTRYRLRCHLCSFLGRAVLGCATMKKCSARTSKAAHDIFDMREIDRQHGCLVIVRPDQFISHILPLDGHTELTAFFDGFMLQE